jgi:hypothetical protein
MGIVVDAVKGKQPLKGRFYFDDFGIAKAMPRYEAIGYPVGDA